jgi:2-phosphosulfolactate phosphatase
MRLDVMFVPAELGTAGAAGRAVVVIDVLRATTTMVEAFSNGARDIIASDSVEQAVRRAQEIGRDQTILCGERDIDAIAGFDLGNSPLEFTREKVEGKTLVMTTTNGTRALLLGGTGSVCVAGGLLNAGAVARHLAGQEDVLLLCAGREGRFAAEDAVGAGVIARRLVAGRSEEGETARPELNDAARVAMLLARRYGDRLTRFLGRTSAGRNLSRLGRGDEVEYCARVDHRDVVPRFVDRRLIL